MIGGMYSLLPYGTGICRDRIIYSFVNLYFFCPLILFMFCFYLVSINQTEWLTIAAYPSLTCSFNRGNTEATNSSNIGVWSLCMHVLVYVCVRIDFVYGLEKGCICQTNSEMCICVWPSLLVPRRPSVADRTLKSNC